MSYSFKLCPTHFSWGGEKFSKGVFARPCAPPSYGPVFNFCFDCRFDLLQSRKCTRSHTCRLLYVFPNVQRIFSANTFSLGNLFLLTNFEKLFTVSHTVTIVAHIFIKRCYACSTVVTITYCRDGQLI